MPLVVGTAGHIDHGKTSLVRALTGIDLDDTPEERARGITIELGFAHLDLADGRRIGLVDVPGHEKLVRTMVAGATGLDAVMLVVSAVDGVMPQTREHLQILGHLGVTEGFVVLTMADLVDDEMLALAVDDVVDAVSGTFLAGRPVLPVANPTGVGIDAVRDALTGLRPRPRARDGAFRLPVDRAFVRPGFGTVVTGTATSGRLNADAPVRIEPGGQATRVRGMVVHGRPATVAEAGQRVALNLGSVEVADVPRGTVIVAGPVAVTQMLDVWLDAASRVADGAPVRFLTGTAEQVGRVALVAEGRLDGGIPAQVRLDAPVAVWPGDAFVLRRVSPVETLGGGVIVDPWAPRLRMRDRDRHLVSLVALRGGDRAAWLRRAGPEGLSRAEAVERGCSQTGIALGDRVLAAEEVAAHQQALHDALTDFHAAHPLERGAGRREVRVHRLAALTDRAWEALVDHAIARGSVASDGATLRRADFTLRLDAAEVARRDALQRFFTDAGPGGADAADLARAFPGTELAAYVRMLEDAGLVEAVPGIGWADRSALDRVRSDVSAWFSQHAELRPVDFKVLTGLARKGAIPLLEWLDRQRITRRQGDVRVAGSGIRSDGGAPP